MHCTVYHSARVATYITVYLSCRLAELEERYKDKVEEVSCVFGVNLMRAMLLRVSILYWHVPLWSSLRCSRRDTLSVMSPRLVQLSAVVVVVFWQGYELYTYSYLLIHSCSKIELTEFLCIICKAIAEPPTVGTPPILAHCHASILGT